MRRSTYFKTLLVGLSLSLLPGAAGAACAQKGAAAIDRDAALKGVRVAAVAGWKEATSEKGRFRILFPRAPEVADEPGGRGFELNDGKTKWFALYVDFDSAVPAADAELRQKYKESAEALASKGSKLIRSRDVTLNGRLGREIILVGRGAKSYLRTFQIGSRLYTLAVDVYGDSGEADEMPPEVQQFFDSFTFWG
jgi:hypothetical protein